MGLARRDGSHTVVTMQPRTALGILSTAACRPAQACSREVGNSSAALAPFLRDAKQGRTHLRLFAAPNKPTQALRCNVNNSSGSSWRAGGGRRTRKDLRLPAALKREVQPNLTQSRLLSTAALACRKSMANPDSELLVALEASSLKGEEGWVPYGLPLKAAFAAVSSVNIAAALDMASSPGLGSAAQHPELAPDDGKQAPNPLELLISAAWDLPDSRVSFLLLERHQRRFRGLQHMPYKGRKTTPILLPLVVNAADTFAYELHPSRSLQENSLDQSQPAALVLLQCTNTSQGVALQLRVRRASPQQLLPIFIQTLQKRSEIQDHARVDEALALLRAVVAADIIAAPQRPVDGGSSQHIASAWPGTTDSSGSSSLGLEDLLLTVLEHAVDCIVEASRFLSPCSLLQAVGALIHLGTPRPLSILPTPHVEKALLRLLGAAKPLLLEHQRHLELLFCGKDENDRSSTRSSTDGDSTTAETSNCSIDDRNARSEWDRGGPPLQLPLKDAVIVLALLGWMQRRGPPAGRSCGAELLASIADCVGEI